MKSRINLQGLTSLVLAGMLLLLMQACAPEIITFTPEEGNVGTEVLIEGKRFGETAAENTVRFGNVISPVSGIPEPGKIITSVPAGAVTGPISIETTKGIGYSDQHFIVPEADSAQWTFMVFIDGDNNLETAALEDFLEMAQVGSTSEMNILVQMDRRPGYTSAQGDWTDTRRFRVEYGSVPSDPPLANLGEANMGDPAVLQDFVEWGIQDYPAKHYALVIWNHGDGWRDAREALMARSAEEVSRGDTLTPIARAISSDDTNNDILFMKEVQNALTAARDRNNSLVKLDLVGFDACLMGMIEVAYAIRDHAMVMVGSEQMEPWDGWPYDAILTDLNVHISDFGPEELGSTIVNRYYESYMGESGITQAAVRIAGLEQLVSRINDFTAVATTGWSALQNARSSTLAYNPGFYSFWGTDLRGFAHQVSLFTESTDIRSAALSLRDALDQIVIQEQHSTDMDGSHGLAIYFPPNLAAFNNDPDHRAYMDGNTFMPVDFVDHHSWDNWLQVFYQH